MDTQSPTTDTSALLEFMFRLGQAYLACGEQTAKVELLLRRTATAHGIRRPRVVAFPTAVFISLHDGADERVTLAEGPTQTLRLDQIADVYALGAAAQRGEVAPREGLERLTAILRKTARFGPTGVVVGHTILTVGLAIVLMPALMNLAAAAVLGALVGALKVFNRDRPVLAVPLPVVAAGMVSALVFLAVKRGLPVDPLHVLVPPLVAFLPGGTLTLGMVELAYGDMVSGSSRLITGFVQLVLLALASRPAPCSSATAPRIWSMRPGSSSRRPGSTGRRGPAWWCSGWGPFSISPRPGTRSGGCFSCCSSRSRRSNWRPASSSTRAAASSACWSRRRSAT
jgi:uncharacterized membrane protein YjjP (DUF1212 family)